MSMLLPHFSFFQMLLLLKQQRLQGFDDNWTNTGISERMRYFCMGNSLVVPIVTQMAMVLDAFMNKEL